MIKKFTTKPKFINVKGSNVIKFKILFFWDYELNNKTKDILLERIIQTTNGKYKTNRELIIKEDELSIINWNARISYFANKTYISFSLTIPRENLLENYSIDECLSFFYDCIFNVNASDGKFDSDVFNREKEYLYDMMKNYPSNIYEILHKERNEALNSIEKTYLTREESINNLNSITPESLYEYYEKNIKNNIYITYIYGNLEEKDKISDLYNKYFKRNYQKILLDVEYFKLLRIADYEKKELNIDYEQTILTLIYQFKGLEKEDMETLEMFYFFLNSRENDLIYNALRHKNHLVYGVDVSINTHGFIEINAYLDRKDIAKTKKLINGVFDDIKDEEKFNKYKRRLLRALKYDIDFSRDNKFYLAENKLDKEVGHNYTLETKYKLIREISYEEMKKLVMSARLVREIVMIGDKNV